MGIWKEKSKCVKCGKQIEDDIVSHEGAAINMRDLLSEEDKKMCDDCLLEKGMGAVIGACSVCGDEVCSIEWNEHIQKGFSGNQLLCSACQADKILALIN